VRGRDHVFNPHRLRGRVHRLKRTIDDVTATWTMRRRSWARITSTNNSRHVAVVVLVEGGMYFATVV